MRRSARLLCVVFVAAELLAAAPARAQASEASVKAAFLPRFARYVSWPAVAVPKDNDPFVLCVVGSSSFGNAVESAARSQSVDGRRVIVRKVSNPGSIAGCHIAFISGGGNQRAGQMLAAIGRRPVLTVTDTGSGAQRGIIHFTVVNGRVRFFIDQAAAQQRGLQISSRLLALAVGVRQ